ncbi:hypothetical protein HYALB_00008763 [Hymenoscyphus albidus]|uniref:DUF4048 domain-containing protein n=1 Tax=Hymenoscyphus albidus TaxID=595503 RepID=A0A9N9Q4F1_9HELO|nr:hypothetical protein HYALB_00008763 [Hymenoscyphus albidus]
MITQRTTFFPFLPHEISQVTNNTICAMEHHNRRQSIDLASVESILSSGENKAPAAIVSPHLGMSPTRPNAEMAPPPQPTAGHTRNSSSTTTTRVRPVRPLSLSFPVAPNLPGNESTRPTPATATFPPTPMEIAPSPSDPDGFLVALAAQERKVLELKEELNKAERDLHNLKRQWASHESSKKRAEIKHNAPLQQLQTVALDNSSKDASTIVTRHSAEMDRRKMLLSNINIPKESRRKVITGGHTRTLSLLSPERSNYPRPFPPPPDTTSDQPASAGFTRTDSMPSTSQGLTRGLALRARPLSYQGGLALASNAKLIAEDLRNGMWGFMEDIRQATVGDEAAHEPTKQNLGVRAPSRKVSRGNLRNADRTRKVSTPRSASPRNWETLTGTPAPAEWEQSEHEQTTQTTTGLKSKAPKTVSLAASALDDLDDDWSNWDSPPPKSPRWSSSTTASDPATPSNSNLDDRAIKILDQLDTPSKDLQWPASLDILTPGNIRKTFSTVMQDWEKSLSPSLVEEGPREMSLESAVGSGETKDDSEATHEALMLSR